MQITLRSKPARYSLMVGVAIGVMTVVVWISKTYLADVVARKAEVKNLELATRLDPGNSDYHVELADIFEYQVPDVDPVRAIQHLKQAVELNPYDAQAWLSLGLALELQGNISEADACLRHADFLAPRIPAAQWISGNNLLLHGDVDEAFRHFKVVLAGTPRYDRILFDRAWKASGDPDKILERLIPNHVPTEFDYLYYLLEQKRYLEAQKVWKRIASSSQAFPPMQASTYIDNLIGARRWPEAYQVWNDLRQKNLIKSSYDASGRNLLLNGDFEEEMLGMGFDWRIVAVEDVSVGLDDTTFHSPGHSLLIEFPGEKNLDYRGVWQFVPVAPRQAYRLQGLIKTEGITTDSGPRLEVRDAYDYRNLDKFSELLTGTTGWTQVTVDFTTGPNTELVIVGVVRLASGKIDNRIAGKTWVDDLRLEASVGSKATGQRKAPTAE